MRLNAENSVIFESQDSARTIWKVSKSLKWIKIPGQNCLPLKLFQKLFDKGIGYLGGRYKVTSKWQNSLTSKPERSKSYLALNDRSTGAR